MFLLANCNSFYASCEKAFRPDLAKSPVAVLSNNDGCVVAASPEAKALGLATGAPYFKVKHLSAKGLVVFSSNYTLYGDMSRRIMGLLSKFADRIEVYSIDEAFLEINRLPDHDAAAYGQDMALSVKKCTGIPISVGAARTKTLAKIANRFAKKKGVRSLALLDDADVDAVLKDLPVADIWGISDKLGNRLARLGIVTAADLKRASIDSLRKNFGVVMERTARELRGQKCLELDDQPGPRQQIHVSRSFGELVGDLESLEEAAATFAARVGEKLRLQRCVASGIYVYVATNRFREQDKQYSDGTAMTILPATNHTGKIIGLALSGLRRIFRSGYWYKKVGVMALDIQSAESALAQGSLFTQREVQEDDSRLMGAIDSVNRKFGTGTMFFGSQGMRKTAGWRMRRGLLSPSYTTRWEDVPTVG